jgi:hypothetical protein
MIREIIDEMRETKNVSETLIAWMVTNCGAQSERGNFVEELQKFIKVDIYGGCGKLKVQYN